MQSYEQQDGTANQSMSMGSKARQMVSQAEAKAGEQVRSGISAGKTRAASALHGVAESLLNGSAQQEDGLGQYIRQAGEQVQRAAEFLDTTDARELTRRTEAYARAQPAVFIGGAFAIGILAARFFRSSHHDNSERQGNGEQAGASQYGANGGLLPRQDQERRLDVYVEPTAPDNTRAGGGRHP